MDEVEVDVGDAELRDESPRRSWTGYDMREIETERREKKNKHMNDINVGDVNAPSANYHESTHSRPSPPTRRTSS